MNAATLRRLVELLGPQGAEDIAWSQGIKPPVDAIDFAQEAIFVICNSGMHNVVARSIYTRVAKALWDGQSAGSVFGHRGKAAAIDRIWGERESLFADYRAAADKVAWLETLPWIGAITKWHLAKNFGVDCAKPDVHLVRVAERAGTTPQLLCERLARETGYRVATVDLVIWRACALKILNSRTGEIAQGARP